tara:strand:+ start:1140 stop:1400 length:261 start_codon:yes stop_codon:yes gene_type:complete
MVIKLSYWEVEQAVINYLKEKFKWPLESEQFQGSNIETSFTTYKYKKDKDGNEVVDREKSTTKTKELTFDSNSEIEFWVDAEEDES